VDPFVVVVVVGVVVVGVVLFVKFCFSLDG